MRRDALTVAFLWLVLTAAGEALAVTWNYFPLAAAAEALIVDGAFRNLVILAVPVFAFVLSTLIYSAWRFRRRGEQREDGPPIHSSRPVVVTWILATTALTLLLMVFPGATGLLELRGQAHAKEEGKDLLVQVESGRWFWIMTYPQHGVVTANELVLPVGQRVRFEVSSIDVIHSFWVPAFRMKVDAVPGLVTTVSMTPDKVGTFQYNSGFRLQCAELCGGGHSLMRVAVRVVEPGEFEAWVAQQKSGQ